MAYTETVCYQLEPGLELAECSEYRECTVMESDEGHFCSLCSPANSKTIAISALQIAYFIIIMSTPR